MENEEMKYSKVKRRELSGFRSIPVHLFEVLLKAIYLSNSFGGKLKKDDIGKRLSDKEVISRYAKSTKNGGMYFEKSDLMKSMELKKSFSEKYK